LGRRRLERPGPGWADQGYAVEWEFHLSRPGGKSLARASRVSPILVSPILEEGVWFVASTGWWQPVFIRVQSMKQSHRFYHPPTCGGHVTPCRSFEGLQWCPGQRPGVRRRLPKLGLDVAAGVARVRST
jgi:hypothetical protein